MGHTDRDPLPLDAPRTVILNFIPDPDQETRRPLFVPVCQRPQTHFHLKGSFPAGNIGGQQMDITIGTATYTLQATCIDPPILHGIGPVIRPQPHPVRNLFPVTLKSMGLSLCAATKKEKHE